MALEPWLGAGLALASGLVWGSGDFAGGLASRRVNSIRVTAMAALIGMLGMAALGLLVGEALPDSRGALWSAAAGLAGTIGILALYRALASGQMAVVAPITAVVGAGLTVLFGAVLEGPPGPLKMIGFATGLVGIGLASRPGGHGAPTLPRPVLLAILSGLGFGLFFVGMAQLPAGSVLWPLAIARCVMWITALLIVKPRRNALVDPRVHPLVIASGVLDTAGNLLYLLARQHTRLDVSAVLASLYPVSTVLLARAFLGERLSKGQTAGVGLALVAVVLIAA